MNKTVYIKDFISLPCSDAAEGIRKAFETALETGADRIEFEKGVYPLKTFIETKTDQTAHDAGAELKPTKDVHILIKDFKNICVCGKTDEDGNPATVLAGLNTGKLHDLLPSILWADGGENITIENFKFKRDPEFASAGRVESVTNDTITLRVFDGNPCHDNMGTYCLNKFTPDGSALSGESLSYGFGLSEPFRLIGDRLLSLKDARVASMVQKDDIISFHQGAKTDFQCFFGNIKNLTLRNLWTSNSNGFAHLAFNIHNLTAENVKFKPEGNQYFTAPRDAFKLHKCSGKIHIKRMYTEGVRMDGQNMHSNFIFPLEQISNDTVRYFTRYSYLPIADGTDMEFYFPNDPEKHIAKIRHAKHDGTSVHDGHPGQLFTVTFTKPLPYTVDKDTLCLAACWEPDLYTCSDSVFKNIAGAGHLSRIDHMRISNCTYQNLMNSGILLGTELPTHVEGGHATDVIIKDCTFDGCGNTARYGARGCIGIKSSGLPGPNNRDIHIENCTFKNSDVGIDIHDSRSVFVKNCKFDNILNEICIENSTSDKIYIDSDKIL